MTSPARRHRRMAAVATGALATGALLLALAPTARADDKQACVASSEKAQQLRNAGKLSEAREQLVSCSRPECPKLIQQDCTQWMSEVLHILPSVVPAARDRRGRDIVDAKVSIDGKLVAESLDGKAIAVDPGVHAFHWETKGAPPIDDQIVVRQGEKNRLITTTFAIGDEPAKTPGGGSGSGVTVDAGGDGGGGRPLPVAAMIVGGLGLVGGGVALYLGLSADADGRNLRDTCAPKCTDAQVQDVKDKQNLARIVGVASGIVFGAGVVLLVLHYTTGSGARSGKATTPGLTLEPAANGAATVVRF